MGGANTIRLIQSLVVCGALASAGFSQTTRSAATDISPRSVETAHSRAPQGERGTYRPRIEGSSASFIVRGRVIGITEKTLSVQTSTGARYTFKLDGETSVLDSQEPVSLATIGDLELKVSDLRLNDRIEVVAERVGRQALARIVTREVAAPKDGME